MDSESGVALEDEIGSVGKTVVRVPVLDLQQEKEHVSNGEKLGNGKGLSVTVGEADEGFVKSGVEVESSANVSEVKTTNSSKPKNEDNLNNRKMSEVKAHNSKPQSAFANSKKPNLSFSLSLPIRGVRADGTKKVSDTHPQTNGATERTASSVSHSKPTSRRASMLVNPKEANKKGTEALKRRTTLAYIPSLGPPAGKSLSVDAAANNASTEILLNAAPHEQRRITASRFSFRLDERAEKRREFFSKLDEKIQARETEKNNLQAKSKESLEAEIKRLRKSLTFKATPMPSFYKEPPAKIEPKKIPLTRAISPKFGRRRSFNTNANKSMDGGGSSLSPDLVNQQGESSKEVKSGISNKHAVASKKQIKKSLSKPRCVEFIVTKAEIEPGNLKQEPAITDVKLAQGDTIKSEEGQDQSLNPPTLEGEINLESEKKSLKEDEATCNFPNSTVIPKEITVENEEHGQI